MKNILSLPRAILFMIVVAVLSLSAFSTVAQTQSSRPVYLRLYTTLGGYQESLPVDYNTNLSKKYPLLIFLHGSGEKGDGSPAQLSKLLRNGPFKFINEGKFPDKFKVNGKDFSFIVVAPQVTGSSGSNAAIGALVNHCLQTYRVDEDRIYITGLSLGGLMSYNFAGSKKAIADKIAATLLVCPNAVSTEERAANIAASNLPVWLTNNDGDNLAKIDNAIKTVDMINANHPLPEAKITIFNKTGHDAWTKSYDPNFKENGMNVYEWMLTYTTKRNTMAPPPPVVVAVPPVVDAGANKIIILPEDSVMLEGSASVAAGSSVKSYQWNYASGPAAPVIVSPSQKNTSVKKLVQGSYVFALKVTDANGNSSSDNVTITVNPAPVVVPAPTQYLTANAGADQTITMPATTATLNGTKSTAATGGSIKSYAWSKVSGPASSGDIASVSASTTSVINLVPGSYVYRLTVTDNAGKTATDDVTVLVKYKSGVLKANAGADQTVTYPLTGQLVFDGSASTAPAGSTITSGWKRLSGPEAYGAVMYPSGNLITTTSKGLVPGVYVYQLQLKDENKNTSADTMVITVVDNSSSKPTAASLASNAGADQTITMPATTATLNGTGSTAATGGSIKSYAWSKVSGPNSSGDIANASASTTSVINLVPGSYVYRLTITDNTGKTATDDVTITVKYKSGALKANAGADQTVTYPLTGQLVFDGSASTAPAGSTITSGWKRLSGPEAYGAVLYPSTNLITTTSKGLIAGVYIYQLTLKDENKNTSTDTVVITVKSTVSSRISELSTQQRSADELTLNAYTSATQNQVPDVKINPNPVTTDMTVWIDGSVYGKTSVLVYNLQGILLLQQSFVKDVSGKISKSFNVAQLPAGTYFVKVAIDNKATQTVQMIKQ